MGSWRNASVTCCETEEDRTTQALEAGVRSQFGVVSRAFPRCRKFGSHGHQLAHLGNGFCTMSGGRHVFTCRICICISFPILILILICYVWGFTEPSSEGKPTRTGKCSPLKWVLDCVCCGGSQSPVPRESRLAQENAGEIPYTGKSLIKGNPVSGEIPYTGKSRHSHKGKCGRAQACTAGTSACRPTDNR